MATREAEIVYCDDIGPEYNGKLYITCGRGVGDNPCDNAHLLIVEDCQYIEDLGCDGGEPEDQLLCRDWQWVQGLAQRALDAESERDAARALAGRLRRATLDALLPVDSPAWGHRPEADAVLRGAAKAVPAEWEPKP